MSERIGSPISAFPRTASAKGEDAGTAARRAAACRSIGTAPKMPVMLAKRIFWCVAATLCLVAPSCSCEGRASCETCAVDGGSDGGAPDSAVADSGSTDSGGADACTPARCADLGKNCGPVPDGCGGTLDCGACASQMTCGGG